MHFNIISIRVSSGSNIIYEKLFKFYPLAYFGDLTPHSAGKIP
jgi:hypothetical protein